MSDVRGEEGERLKGMALWTEPVDLEWLLSPEEVSRGEGRSEGR